MKVLFISGTGIISAACTRLAMSRGFQLTVSWDRLIAQYERGLEAARREFGFGI